MNYWKSRRLRFEAIFSRAASYGWSASDLAKRAGVHRVTIWRHLSDEPVPRDSTLWKLAQAVDLEFYIREKRAVIRKAKKRIQKARASAWRS